MDGVLINNRYRIVRQVAKGSQGVVFLAFDELLYNRKRAIKRVHYSEKNSITLAMHEVNVLASLYHSAIPTVIDSVCDEELECLYIVMDWVEGTRLDVIISNINRVDRIELFRAGMKQLLFLFDQLHNHPSNSYIYCDLKPDNILIESNLNFKLVDFGIAVSTNREQSQIIGTGNIHFSASEFFVEGIVDSRNDLFSLGCVLFYILSEGQFVNEKNLNRINWTIGITAFEVNTVLRLVEVRATNRFQNISEVIVDYKKWLFSLGLSDILGTIS